MIQTKTSIVYGDRSERTGIIKVEVRPLQTTDLGTEFLVIDWDISKEIPANELPTPIFSKTVFWTKIEVDAADAYLEYMHDFDGLSKSEKEWKKLQLMLLYDTQTNLLASGNTIYRRQPSDWELTPTL